MAGRPPRDVGIRPLTRRDVSCNAITLVAQRFGSSAAAVDIFSKYLTTDIPIAQVETARFGGDRGATTAAMISTAADAMYSLGEENRFLEVTYASGDTEVLYFKDVASGAMTACIVRRAKKIALKRHISSGEEGPTTEDLLAGVREEFKENEDLPNTSGSSPPASTCSGEPHRAAARPSQHPSRTCHSIAGVRPMCHVLPGEHRRNQACDSPRCFVASAHLAKQPALPPGRCRGRSRCEGQRDCLRERHISHRVVGDTEATTP